MEKVGKENTNTKNLGLNNCCTNIPSTIYESWIYSVLLMMSPVCSSYRLITLKLGFFKITFHSSQVTPIVKSSHPNKYEVVC